MKVLVTDPCYICDNDDVWRNVCNALFTGDHTDYSNASKILSDYLGTDVTMHDTGFGDWSNSISGPGVIDPEFYADAGLVCVVALTDRVLEEIRKKYNHIPGAVFEASSFSVDDVAFDDSNPNWTRVIIMTPEGVIESTDESYEEGETDYEGDYFEDE